LVFDAFNEKLILSKYYGKEYQDSRFIKNKKPKTFTKPDLLSVLENEKTNFNELIENFCGVLEDNCIFNELSPDENKEEVIIQIRELNMFKVLQEEVKK